MARDVIDAAQRPTGSPHFGHDGAGVAALAPEVLLEHYDDLAALLDRLVQAA
jgi:hypothetical protein